MLGRMARCLVHHPNDFHVTGNRMKGYGLPLTERELALAEVLDKEIARQSYSAKEVGHVMLCIWIMTFKDRGLIETDAIQSLGEAWDKVSPE